MDGKKIKSIKIVLFSLILILLLVVRDLFNVELNKSIFTVFAVVFFFISTPEEIIEMFSLMMPLFWGLPGTYILLGACIILIIKTKKNPVKSMTIGSMALVLELIASMWFPSFDYAMLVKYICSVFLLVFCIYETDIKIDYKKCMIYFLCGCCALCFIIVISTMKTASTDWLNMFSKGWFRVGVVENEGMTLTVNANNFGYYSCAGICCALTLMKTTTKKILYILAILGLIYCGILSLSRTWIILVALCMFIYSSVAFFSPRKMIIVIASLFICLYVANFFLSKYPEIYEGIFSRFTDSTMDTAGGRTDIMENYLDAYSHLPRAWFIGTGVQEYSSVLNMLGAIHNGTEQIIICLGIPFGICFLIMLIRPVILLSQNHIPILYWLPIIGIVLFLQSLQFLNPDTLMFPYIIGVFALRLGAQEQEERPMNHG